MYQFLCIDANLPPPYLEIHWRDSANGSLEEMDMEEMFDGRDDEMDDDEEEEDDEDEESDDDDDEDDEDDAEGEFDVDIDDVPTVEQKPTQTVFGFGDPAASAAAAPVEKKKRTASKGGDKAQSKSKRAAGQDQHFHQGQQGQSASQYAMNRHAKENNAAAAMEEDENDGLDIQSLSVVEAEFIYNKIDEGKTQGAIEKKRTINLEAFKIIRVIGKGKSHF